MKSKLSIKNTLAAVAVVLTAAGVGAIGVTQANAQTATTDNPMTSLVQKIAQKFNLNQSDVQAVFDQDRTDRQAQMEAKYQEQLSQYVSDGKITQTQKDLISAKHKEIQAKHQSQMQSMKNMNDADREAAMEAKKTERTELENWAKENNIDMKYLMPFGKGRMRGHGGPSMRGADTSQASTQASPTVTQ